MPCDPISFPSPTSPSGPAIPGFGIPFSFPVPSITFPAGFPEDLLDIFDNLQMLIPPGLLQPALNPNFGKDIFDGIMKLLDQFMPFLLLYKFFLPILNLIICIIEVLCALVNPFALISALDKLFTQCIPAFLNLFPIFALILMIIALLLLLLRLIEYIILKIIEFVLALIRNIVALVIAFEESNTVGVLAIANKLGALLCIFQNLFVLLAFFAIIIQAIKDILTLSFAIPPCDSGDNSNCCGVLTCPGIVQAPFTNNTGVLQYTSEVGTQTTIPVPTTVSPSGFLNIDSRTESWQFYDPDQVLAQQFWNISSAYDVIADGYTPPVYFPTTSTFTDSTPPAQAAYTLDITVPYNPSTWGRTGNAQKIIFKNCIILAAPTQTLAGYDNTTNTALSVPNGVVLIAGGLGYLADGITPIDGYTFTNTAAPLMPFVQATLGNFIHLAPTFSAAPPPLSNEGVVILPNVEYTFTPNQAVLMQANLITLGCQPTFALNKAFVNNVIFSNINTQTSNLKNLVNSPDFPDPAATQTCLLNAMSVLRNNMTTAGVTEFQASANACLATLQNNTQNALIAVMGIGFSPCNSNFTLTPSTQFTTQPITVTVNLNENNGLPIANVVPAIIGNELASQITAYPTFGEISSFSYDGYKAFNALLTSETAGNGSIMIAFQNQILCNNSMPVGGTPSHTLQSLDYEFVYTPLNNNIPSTGEGDTVGKPDRNNNGN